MPPFRGSVARAAGAHTRASLRRSCRPLHRDVYLDGDIDLTARERALAAWLLTGAPLAGVSAAAMFGTRWLDAAAPAEILRPDRHAPKGIVVRSWHLAEGELCIRDGVHLTSAARTAFDLARLRPVDDAVPMLDALARATGVGRAAVAAVARAHPGARGVRRVAGALALMDAGAESPPESRLRMLIFRAGMPAPQTQIAFPQLRVRVDMGWVRWKVAVEYDGRQHWEDDRQRAWDIERLGLLEDAGWTVVRVSAAMMRRPDDVVARIRARLLAQGAPV